jgi:hypothetical protein
VSPDKQKRPKKTSKRPAPKLRVVKSDDPGAPYIVRWYPDAESARDASWPPEEKVAMEHAVDKLKAAGPRLMHPHSSAVQGATGKGFRELRPRAGRSRWRPIYRRVTPSTFVIVAVAPEAQIDQRGFDAAVARAVERFSKIDLG